MSTKIHNSALEKRTKHAFRCIAKQIANLIEESSELSRAAKTYLKTFDKPWLKQIVADV
jgi:hypothetical protein